ncbi:fungal-specific transcription factor domain-containing protein [Chaetomium strumarium]|uniref:Fungal-specific transcription factor domain-containing protein n=1 Tax=Chaetomium strumarium TaxID=1170767 RepID=A0AAJ0M500_9PEZI|nr:fungal-specific transcription factor domain-containing protein [Chaetomium strumarium]
MGHAARSRDVHPRTRARELRSRSGCWKCRERRVKCPEQRPICGHCKRLGFVCAYDVRLSWQTAVTPQAGPRGRKAEPTVEHWMFLNTTIFDFIDAACADSGISLWDDVSLCDVSSVSPSTPANSTTTSTTIHDDSSLSSPCPSTPSQQIQVRPTTRYAGDTTSTRGHWDSTSHISPYYYLSPLSMDSEDSYLWEYFATCVTPHCSLDETTNPYQNVILRVAASSPHGPLFQCILGASANQLYNLGHASFGAKSWQCRANALALLTRGVTDEACRADMDSSSRLDPDSAAQLIGSAVMLCFSEILQDCSQTWTAHASFALSYLQKYEAGLEDVAPVLHELAHFAVAYFTYHVALASTASMTAASQRPPLLPLRRAITTSHHESHSRTRTTLQSLTGCSDRLLDLISAITQLSHERERLHPLPVPDFQSRRDDIERELHVLRQDQPLLPVEIITTHSSPPGSEQGQGQEQRQFDEVAELKRLTTLLYLYARLDNAGPREPHVMRLTAGILGMLPHISLRTNTTLWSLFMVATLGVRPESDGDRKLVMERLTALQRTRELGNVRMARLVIEDVWKRRDLRPECANVGWGVLKGREGAISLA